MLSIAEFRAYVSSALICTALFFPFLMLAGPAQAKIYKWVDENGKVHYSDKKHDQKEQVVVDIKPSPSSWSRFDIKIVTKDVVLTEAENQLIADGVNNVYEFFDQVLFFDIYETVPVNILVLKDKDTYRNYLYQNKKGLLVNSYGVYISSQNQIVVYVQEDRQLTFRTIKHEVGHAVVDTIIPYAPAWLNEGLAEQMEMLEKNDEGLYLEPHPRNRSIVAKAYSSGRLINIDDFLKLPSSKWRHNQTTTNGSLQAQAGQFLYFLFSKPTSRNFVVRLMHNFDRGDRTLSYFLVNDNYIGGIKVLEIAWNNWLQRQSDQKIKL
ncbi:MAG: DUF4124 domain-containing protein [Pseudomonadales bacterium]|nr:DUF4124 domain-containing protein [Pseudomonadales bacterium]